MQMRARGLTPSFLIASLAVSPSAFGGVIKLRASCTGETGICKTTMADVLTEIHQPGSLPSATNPVVVDIGPGEFSLSSTTLKYCQPVDSTTLSHLTFRGAGEQATVITGGGFAPTYPGLDDGGNRVVAIDSCDDVEFRDLTIRSESGIPAGVEFVGDGSTYWNNVTIDAETYGWYDGGASSPPDSSVHWWWDSTIKTTAKSTTTGYSAAFYPLASTQNIFGSTLSATDSTSSGLVFYGTMYESGYTTVRVHGSRLVSKGPRSIVYGAFIGLSTCGTAPTKFDVEGSTIDVASTATSGSPTVVGIRNFGHAISSKGSHFTLSGPSGVTKKRVLGACSSAGTGFADTYDLGAAANPPVSNSTWSYAGLDTFVETDCSATKCNDTSQGSERHLLIFDPSCSTAGPWFDSTVQKCRGV